MLQSLQKTAWKFLRKLQTHMPYDLVIPLLSVQCLLKRNENVNPHKNLYVNVHRGFIQMPKSGKKTNIHQPVSGQTTQQQTGTHYGQSVKDVGSKATGYYDSMCSL